MARRDAEVENGNGSLVDPGTAASNGGVSSSFERDRLAEHWDAGQPVRPEDSVSAIVARFSPRAVPEKTWARIGPVVRASVEESVPRTRYSAQLLLTIVTELAIWVDTLGLPVEPRVLFHPDTVDRFATEGCAHLAPGTQLNYRTWLRRVGTALVPDLYPPGPLPLPRSDPLGPYARWEISALEAWARGLPTARYRHNASVILSFGLGAGLTSQALSRLVGDDVTSGRDGVVVHLIGDKPRDVPVLLRWEDPVAALAAEAGAGPIFLPERRGITRRQVPNFIARCPTGDAPRLHMNRLRNTWIVHHLSAGTHLGVVAEAAGVDASQLIKYQRFATIPQPSEARRLLREATAR
jgi:hypothetical protein